MRRFNLPWLVNAFLAKNQTAREILILELQPLTGFLLT